LGASSSAAGLRTIQKYRLAKLKIIEKAVLSRDTMAKTYK
jgi:hypothetical protein